MKRTGTILAAVALAVLAATAGTAANKRGEMSTAGADMTRAESCAVVAATWHTLKRGSWQTLGCSDIELGA